MDDIENLEHSGEWDHGVETNAMDVAKADDNQKGPKQLAKQVQTSVTNLMHSISDKVQQGLHDVKEGLNDPHFKEEVEGHTSEEVAGMKLCVSKNVHQDSFSAP
jgi:hypothetical protein